VLASLLVFLLALKIVIVRCFKQFIKYVPVMGLTVIVLALLVATVSLGFFLVTTGVGRGAEVAEVDPSSAVALADAANDETAPEPNGEPVTGAYDETVADEPPEDSVEVPGDSVEVHSEVSSEVPSEEPDDVPVEDPAVASPGDTTVPQEEPSEVPPAAEPVVPVEETPPGDATAGETVFAGNCASCHNADSAAAKIGPGLAGLFGREKLGASGKPVTLENVRAQIVDPAGTMPSFGSYLSDGEIDDLVAYLGTL
jgi:mono/diheme cytochrome c family protein